MRVSPMTRGPLNTNPVETTLAGILTGSGLGPFSSLPSSLFGGRLGGLLPSLADNFLQDFLSIDPELEKELLRLDAALISLNQKMSAIEKKKSGKTLAPELQACFDVVAGLVKQLNHMSVVVDVRKGELGSVSKIETLPEFGRWQRGGGSRTSLQEMKGGYLISLNCAFRRCVLH